MKKIALFLCFFLIFSCSYQDRKIDLKPIFSSEEAQEFDSKKLSNIKILVLEKRENPQILGRKKFGKIEVKIASNQNLSEVLAQKFEKILAQNIPQNSFKSGLAKIIELQIERFEYFSNREFFVGNSESKARVKVLIKGFDGKVKFIKNFEVSANSKHFISSSAAADQEAVNELLSDILKEISSDKSFIENL